MCATKPKRKKFTINELAAILRKYVSGKSVEELAEAYNIPRSAMVQIVERRTIGTKSLVLSTEFQALLDDRNKKRKTRHRRGVNQPKSKLNEQQVADIKYFLAEGKRTMTDLAIAYGVSDTVIRQIRDGRSWAWVGNSQSVNTSQKYLTSARMERLFNTTETCEKLAIDGFRLEVMRDDGLIEGKRIGRTWFYSQDAIDKARLALSNKKKKNGNKNSSVSQKQ